MNTAKCTYFFIILISISGCKNNNPISDSSASAILDHEHFEIININPQKSILLKTNDFVDSINFIPLETTIDSEFSEISQIESMDDRYIILDKNTSQILFFTKKGKFLKKISPDSDESPNSYKKILYFTIDKYNKKIYFNDLDSFNKFEFDLDGNLSRVYTKEEIDYHIRENHNINEYQLSYFAYRGFQINKEAPSNIKIFKGDALVHAYLPFDATIITREDTYGSSNYFFDSDSLVFFSKPYSYNIYCFDDLGGMARAFQFQFPNQLCIPEDFTTNPLYSKKRKQFIKNNGKKIYLVTDFFKTGKNLLFRLVGGAYSDKFLYNIPTKSLISLTNYISDSSTNLLPILGNKALAMDKNKILSAFSAKQFTELINNYNKSGGDTNTLPTYINEIYNKGNDQNPILLLTTFKNDVSYDKTF